MSTFLRRLREQWCRADTVVLVSNTLVFLGLLLHPSRHPLGAVYLAVGTALAVQAVQASRARSRLLEALLFGLTMALLWPAAEGLLGVGLGWWGSYLAPGPRIGATPVYALLVGWLTATHLQYWTRRVHDWSGATPVAAAFAALSAFGVGLAGEHLFVAAGYWVYAPAPWTWGGVPAHVPVVYAIVFATLPVLDGLPVPIRALVIVAALIGASALLGLLTGFYPR